MDVVEAEIKFRRRGGRNVKCHFFNYNAHIDWLCYTLRNLLSGSNTQNSTNSPFAFEALNICGGDSSWILDLEATHHITHDSFNLGNATTYSWNDGVLVGNGTSLPIVHTGNTMVPSHDKNFLLNNVLHTPHITSNRIHAHKLCQDNNVSLEFLSNLIFVKEKLQISWYFKVYLIEDFPNWCKTEVLMDLICTQTIHFLY